MAQRASVGLSCRAGLARYGPALSVMMGHYACCGAESMTYDLKILKVDTLKKF